MGHPESKVNMESNDLLKRRSTIDEAIQTVVSKAFQAGFLYLAHQPSSEGGTGRGRMYDLIRLEYYWHHMASDVYTTVYDCTRYVKQGATTKH